MASGDGSGAGPPLSLRPVPIADDRPKNLAEFVARINAQPGGFRSVTERKLRDEIRASSTPNDDEDMSNDDDDVEDDEEEDVTTSIKDANQARMEVLRDIDLAGNNALLTLDSLSLLLSKQNPTQAGVTLSQQLRELVGIGTMGMDKLNDSNATPARTQDRETIALGWTLMETNRSRDAAEEATAFLTREVDAEGRYWEDVIAVHKAGWSICKVPQERHTLGAKFGFSEAAPDFRNNGLAPLRRGDDGSTQLDVGRLGGSSEALVVTYERAGHVVGRSSSRAATDTSSLESRVLEARNTIFSQELWHELTRESRSLAAYDVKPQGSRLVYAIDPTDSIALELLPLDACPPADDSLPENKTAETISMALHILLTYAHRFNELSRIQPSRPHIPRSRGQQQPYALLRPIIARIMALRSTKSLTQHVGLLVRALKSAGLPSSFTLRTPQAHPSDPSPLLGPNQLSGSQTLVRNMLQSQDFSIDFSIVPDVSLTICGRTFIFPVTATYYYVLVPPSSPLHTMCPPFSDGYTTLPALADYLRTAVSRALARHFLAALVAAYPAQQLVQGMQATSIQSMHGGALDLRFAVEEDALVLANLSIVGDKPDCKKWKWAAEGGESRSMEDVVREVAGQILA